MVISNYVKERLRRKHDSIHRYPIPLLRHPIPIGTQNLEDILKKYPPKYSVTERRASNDYQ